MGRVREYQLGTGLRFSAGAYLSNLLDVRPYIPFRYGNYLLLVILAFRVRHPNLQQGDIETLWRTMKPWLLMQLGLTMDKGLRVAQENKWDVRAVWASLSKRVTFLSGMRTPNLTRVRYGQILSANDEENVPYFGVFIEDQFNEYSLLAGVWRGLNPLLPSGSVRWTLTDYSQMSSAVSLCRTPDEKHDLVLCNVSGSDYVWWREEGEWILLGRISLVPRNKHALFRIRGIEIIGIESDKAPGIPGYLSMPSDLQQRIGSDINSALNEMVSVVPVKCEIDIEEGVYTFELRAENSVCESRRLSDTRQLLRLLRLPLVEGIPLQSTKNPGQFFTWDPYSDIEYNGLRLLKPYVERRTPYLNVDLPLPATCRELISKPEMKQEMVIVHDASLCPIAQKTGMDHALCWRIEFPGGCTDSKLVEMSAKGLTDVEIANLLSTKELYTEQGHYTFEIGFSDDPDTRAGTVFRESRAIARTLDMKLTKPGLYLFLDDEKLSCSLVRDGHGIEMHARSSLSDEHVWSGGIVTLKEGWTIKSATKEAETAISEIAEGYFEEETSKERIDDYPGLRRNLARVLSEIQLEDMTKSEQARLNSRRR